VTEPGESRSLQSLRKAVREGRLAHAILLTGESLGTLAHEAMVLAGDLLEPISEGSSANHPANHPDLFTIYPSGSVHEILIGREDQKSRGEYPRNTMRRLISDLQKTSSQGGSKVVILYEADRIRHQAANAFLKTLEEPPPGTHLLLLTAKPYDVLPTINSRCFRFNIPAKCPSLQLPEWEQWKQDFNTWLKELGNLRTGGKPAVGQAMFGLYGLAFRFEQVQQSIASIRKKEETEKLPPDANKGEKEPIEKRVLRETFLNLLKEVEQAIHQVALENPERLTDVQSRNFSQTVSALEELQGLTALNLKNITAFEYFMLYALRIWSQA